MCRRKKVCQIRPYKCLAQLYYIRLHRCMFTGSIVFSYLFYFLDFIASYGFTMQKFKPVCVVKYLVD